MPNRRLAAAPVLISLSLGMPSLAPVPLQADWPQWGGPHRDFSVAPEVTVEPWSDAGPGVFWRREIGPGYSGVVVGDGRLFTMYRQGEREVVAAYSARTGKRLWEHGYAAPLPRDTRALDTSYGEGPNSTPLLAGASVCSLGFTGIVGCVRAKNGKPLWSRDLSADGVAIPYFGHASSPIRYRDTVIVVAGGAHAFDLAGGKRRWSNTSFGASYASAILVERGKRPILVIPAAGEIVGLDPESGQLLWRHEHANQHRTILSSPVAAGDWIFASAYFLGSIGLELSADGSAATERWENPRLQLSHSNAVRDGDWIFGFHNSILTAIHARTGEIGWRHRGIRKANLLKAGDRYLLLDDLGRLLLASLTAEGMTVLADARLFEERAWTAPTLESGTLYVRTRSALTAFDLTGSKAADTPRTSETPVARIEPPEGFLAAKETLITALHVEDQEALAASRETFGGWRDHPSVGHLARYYIALALWGETFSRRGAEALSSVDLAVENLEAALRVDPDFADAHALAGTFYAMYYRLAPGRAAIIGPRSDEHLELARRQDPNNPRVALLRGRRLFDRPAEYGGDPEAGIELMREAIELFEDSTAETPSAEPDWGHALAWYELGSALLRLPAPDRDGARAAFERAVALRPDFTAARRALDPGAPGE